MADGIVTYKQKWENMKSSLQRYKEASKAPLEVALCTVSGVAGGVTGGVLRARLPYLGPVPTGPVLGALAVAGAMLNAEEAWSPAVNSFGTVLIALAAEKKTYELLLPDTAPKLPAAA